MPRAFVILWVVAATNARLLGAPSAASIEGGPDALGKSYHWTITNNHTSPIVRVDIPHYRASLFFAPKGWTSTCTNLVAVGAADEPGVCSATAAAASDGIAPGRSANFGVQLASGAIKRGAGEVVLSFADAGTQKISGVPVPVPETFGDRYIPLLGLGTILVIFVIVQVFRSHKKRPLRADV